MYLCAPPLPPNFNVVGEVNVRTMTMIVRIATETLYNIEIEGGRGA